MLESSMEIQGDIQALRESSMELHINTRGYILWESSMETHIHTRGYTSFVGDQHGNTQALWEFSMETHIHPSQMALLSLLDMSVAFDTVEHNMLIQRRSHSFGIKDRALSWLESYILMDVHNPSICQRRRQIERQLCTRIQRAHAQNALYTNGH